ncbi:LOW QUALITY PROTEIN: hypothetical protein HID58_077289, partial [Brassica napus]
SRTGVKHETLRITKHPILDHFVLAIQKGKKILISLSLFGSSFSFGQEHVKELKLFVVLLMEALLRNESGVMIAKGSEEIQRILKSYDGNMVDASRICFIVWKNMSEETLVKLTLGSHIDLGNIPSGVSLPALKSLFINTIFFTYGDLCNVLLHGCPVLEELSICPACHLILTPASADVSPIEEDAGLRDLIIWLPEEAASCPYFRRNKLHQHLYLLKSGGMCDDGNILQTHGARWSCSIQVLD